MVQSVAVYDFQPKDLMTQSSILFTLWLLFASATLAADHNPNTNKHFAVSLSVMDLLATMMDSPSTVYGFQGEYRPSSHWGVSGYFFSSKTYFSQDSFLNHHSYGVRGNYYFSSTSLRGAYTSLWVERSEKLDRMNECEESWTDLTTGVIAGYRWVFAEHLFFNLGLGYGLPTDKYWLCAYGSNGETGTIDFDLGIAF